MERSEDQNDGPDPEPVAELCEVCGNLSRGTCNTCQRGSFCSEECRDRAHPSSCRQFAAPELLFPVNARLTLTEGEMYATMLARDGVVVIPIYDTAEAREERHHLFIRALESFPEYRRDHRGAFIKYVKSQFGALGNPASFHAPFVRLARKEAMKRAIPVFSALRSL
jgi:hypothetical protein